MSATKGGSVPKRFFIQATVDVHKALQHLAIDLNTSAEKLAGELLRDAVAKMQADLAAKARPTPRPK